MKSVFRVLALATVVALIASAPAMAEDNKIRFGVQWLSPTGDLTFEDSSERVVVEADAAIGPFFEFERMVTSRAAFFGNVSLQTHDVDGELTVLPSGPTTSGTIGEIDVMPVEVGFNFYLVQNDGFEFYLGPKIAYVFFGDVEWDTNSPFFDPLAPEDIPTKDDFGFGANFGLDKTFGDGGWFFHAGLQYLTFAAEIDDGSGDEVDIDPFVVKVGVGKKF